MKYTIKFMACLMVVAMLATLLPLFAVSADEQNYETLPLGGSASSTYGTAYAAPLAFDGDLTTRWNACSYTYGAWLAYNFGKVVTVSDLVIVEYTDLSLCFTCGFDIEYWDIATKTWKICYTGTTIGTELKATLETPVTTRMMRLVFTDYGDRDCGTLTECTFYNGETVVTADLPASSAATPDLPLGISASSIYSSDYTADKAYDGDTATRWNALPRTYNSSWLGFNFGKEVTIDKITMIEYTDTSLCWVIGFEVQVWDKATAAWTTVYHGLTIGTSCTVELDTPVTGQFLRVAFTDLGNKDCLTLTEIALYHGETEVRPMIDCAASSSYPGGYSAYEAFDNNPVTRWSAAGGQYGDSWLMTSFDTAVTIDRVTISEAFDRISSFAIQYQNAAGEWVDCYTGTTIGAAFDAAFDPVSTETVRLYVKTAGGEPSIYEMAFYQGETKHLPSGIAVTKYDNLALTGSVYALDSIVSTGWDGAFLNNGFVETTGGYTSLATMTATESKYVGIDLGKRYLIDEITLWSCGGAEEGWSGIPKSFVVEISSNGSDWNVIKEATNTAVGVQKEISVTFDPVYARFVRIRSTELYPKAVDGNRCYIQLAEMGVYYKKAETLICDETIAGYIQTRPASEGHHDMRVILVGDLEKLSAYSALDVTVTFTTADGTKILKQTLGGNKSDYGLYKVVSADGAYYIAEDGNAMFGNIIAEIPNGAYTAVTVTVTGGETVVYTASAPAA